MARSISGETFMKKYTYFLPILLAFVILGIFSGTAKAQGDEPNYAFVVFETTVTRVGVETSDKNPEERRFYVSNVVAIPSADPAVLRRASKTADEYFTATVVDPLKAKGVAHQYYDDGIRINNNVVYRLDTRAEVEELRVKTLEEIKEQSVNIFTFTWAYGEKTNGLETSHPTLFYREPKSTFYGTGETAAPPKVTHPPVKKP